MLAHICFFLSLYYFLVNKQIFYLLHYCSTLLFLPILWQYVISKQTYFKIFFLYLLLHFTVPTFNYSCNPTPFMKNIVYNSQPIWADNNLKPMHSSEEIVFVLREQVSTLQSQVSILQNENNLICILENNFFKDKLVLKKQNTSLANMITNLNSYIT